MSKKVAIISTCAINTEEYKAFPREIEQIRSMMALERPTWDYHFFDIFNGEFPDIAVFDAFVYSGSPSSVNDNDAWLTGMFDYIRTVFAAEKPQVGLCFGHQAIAKALGGRVDYSPLGWSIGTVATDYTDHTEWMSPALPTLRLFASHNEQVLQLPAGARLLAKTAECPHAAFSIDNRVFATQHHPEMEKAFVEHIVQIESASLTPAQIAKFTQSMVQPDDSKVFAGWIAQFIENASENAIK